MTRYKIMKNMENEQEKEKIYFKLWTLRFELWTINIELWGLNIELYDMCFSPLFHFYRLRISLITLMTRSIFILWTLNIQVWTLNFMICALALYLTFTDYEFH